MRALLLCLVLAACVAPERHELRDGAPVRPAPVFVTPGYTPAGAGLPEYMPGPHEPVRIEPNSRPTRLLPQTPETRRAPGIWAADYDPPWHGIDPVAFGVRLPFLGDELDHYQITVHQETVRRCAFIIRDVGAKEVLEIDLWTLDALDRACFVARMNEHCMAADRTQVERIEARGLQLSDAFRDILRRTRALAAGFADTSCRYSRSKTVQQAIATATRAWSSFDRRDNIDH